MALYPPDDPFLINTLIFGLPLMVRWYGVIIMTGVVVAASWAGRRAQERGIAADHVWSQVMLGLLLGILGARIYYVVFEWPHFAGQSLLTIINPASGGLAIHGALIGATIAAAYYTWRHKLPWRTWLDICMPPFLLAQAIGRWGNFMNQEAYGRPTPFSVGVQIDAANRVDPYRDMAQYPPTTLFHPTFLYESLWNLAGVGLLVALGRRWHTRLRPGDLALGYAIIYGAGRFWIEGLRTDSLCSNGDGGACADALRVAQVASLVLIGIGIVGLALNHRRAAVATHAGETG